MTPTPVIPAPPPAIPRTSTKEDVKEYVRQTPLVPDSPRGDKPVIITSRKGSFQPSSLVPEQKTSFPAAGESAGVSPSAVLKTEKDKAEGESAEVTFSWDADLTYGDRVYFAPESNQFTRKPTDFPIYMDKQTKELTLEKTENSVEVIYDRELESAVKGIVPDIDPLKWKVGANINYYDVLYYDPDKDEITNVRSPKNYPLFVEQDQTQPDKKIITIFSSPTAKPLTYSPEFIRNLAEFESRKLELKRLEEERQKRLSVYSSLTAEELLSKISEKKKGEGLFGGTGFLGLGGVEGEQIYLKDESGKPVPVIVGKRPGALLRLLEWVNVPSEWVEKKIGALEALGKNIIVPSADVRYERDEQGKKFMTALTTKSPPLLSESEATQEMGWNFMIKNFEVRKQAVDLFTQSLQTGDPAQREKAIDMMLESYELERKANIALWKQDPTAVYEFAWNPEVREKVSRARAEAELQLGRPLTQSEYRDVADRYINATDEFVAQLFLDPLNLLDLIPAVAVGVPIGKIIVRFAPDLFGALKFFSKSAAFKLLREFADDLPSLIREGKAVFKELENVDDEAEVVERLRKIAEEGLSSTSKEEATKLLNFWVEGSEVTGKHQPFRTSISDFIVSMTARTVGYATGGVFKAVGKVGKAIGKTKGWQWIAENVIPTNFIRELGEAATQSVGHRIRVSASALASDIVRASPDEETLKQNFDLIANLAGQIIATPKSQWASRVRELSPLLPVSLRSRGSRILGRAVTLFSVYPPDRYSWGGLALEQLRKVKAKYISEELEKLRKMGDEYFTKYYVGGLEAVNSEAQEIAKSDPLITALRGIRNWSGNEELKAKAAAKLGVNSVGSMTPSDVADQLMQHIIREQILQRAAENRVDRMIFNLSPKIQLSNAIADTFMESFISSNRAWQGTNILRNSLLGYLGREKIPVQLFMTAEEILSRNPSDDVLVSIPDAIEALSRATSWTKDLKSRLHAINRALESVGIEGVPLLFDKISTSKMAKILEAKLDMLKKTAGGAGLVKYRNVLNAIDRMQHLFMRFWIQATLLRLPSWVINNAISSTIQAIFYGGLRNVNVKYVFGGKGVKGIYDEIGGEAASLVENYFSLNSVMREITPEMMEKGLINIPYLIRRAWNKRYADFLEDKTSNLFYRIFRFVRNAVLSYGEGLQDANRIVEGSLRIRVFYNYFIRNLRAVELQARKLALRELKAGLSKYGITGVEAEHYIDWAERLWVNSGLNSASLEKIADLRRAAIGSPDASVYIPKEVYEKMSSTGDIHGFLWGLLDDLAGFIEWKASKGLPEKLTPQDIEEFFGLFKKQIDIDAATNDVVNRNALMLWLSEKGMEINSNVVEDMSDDFRRLYFELTNATEWGSVDNETRIKEELRKLGVDVDPSDTPRQAVEKLIEYANASIPDEVIENAVLMEKAAQEAAARAMEGDTSILGKAEAEQRRMFSRFIDRLSETAEQDPERAEILYNFRHLLDTVVDQQRASLMRKLGFLMADIAYEGNKPVGNTPQWVDFWKFRNASYGKFEANLREIENAVRRGEAPPLWRAGSLLEYSGFKPEFSNGNLVSLQLLDFDPMTDEFKLKIFRGHLQDSVVELGKRGFLPRDVTPQLIKQMSDEDLWNMAFLPSRSAGSTLQDYCEHVREVWLKTKPAYRTYEQIIEETVSLSELEQRRAILREFGVPNVAPENSPHLFTNKAKQSLHEFVNNVLETNYKSTDVIPNRTLYDAAKKWAGIRSYIDFDSMKGQKDAIDAARRMIRAMLVEDFEKLYGDFTSRRIADAYMTVLDNIDTTWRELYGDSRNPSMWGSVVHSLRRDGYLDEYLTYGVRGAVRGATDIVRDGRAVIYAFNKSNATTVLHEVFHALRGTELNFSRFMPEEAVRVLNEFAYSYVGRNADVNEILEVQAKAFERYIMEGAVPEVFDKEFQSSLQKALEFLKRVFIAIYEHVVSYFTIDGKEIKLNDEVRKVFNQLVGGWNTTASRIHYMEVVDTRRGLHSALGALLDVLHNPDPSVDRLNDLNIRIANMLRKFPDIEQTTAAKKLVEVFNNPNSSNADKFRAIRKLREEVGKTFYRETVPIFNISPENIEGIISDVYRRYQFTQEGITPQTIRRGMETLMSVSIKELIGDKNDLIIGNLPIHEIYMKNFPDIFPNKTTFLAAKDAATAYIDMRARSVLPIAKEGIQSEVRPGHRIFYRTAREIKESTNILDAALEGEVHKGFSTSTHLGAGGKATLRKSFERNVRNGGKPIFVSPYPSVAGAYHNINTVVPVTFAIEVPENAIVFESTRAKTGQGLAYSVWYCDTETIIDSNLITRIWYVPSDTIEQVTKWAEDLKNAQAKQGYFRGTWKDRDPELAKAGAMAIADLREPPKSLGRPFIEAPLQLREGVEVMKDDRVLLITGDIGKVIGVNLDILPEYGGATVYLKDSLTLPSGYVYGNGVPVDWIVRVLKKSEKVSQEEIFDLQQRFSEIIRAKVIERENMRISVMLKRIERGNYDDFSIPTVLQEIEERKKFLQEYEKRRDILFQLADEFNDLHGGNEIRYAQEFRPINPSVVSNIGKVISEVDANTAAHILSTIPASQRESVIEAVSNISKEKAQKLAQVQFQRTGNFVEGLYSPLETALMEILQGSEQNLVPRNRLISMLRGRGVKEEELRWTGFYEKFPSPDQLVDIREALDFVRWNQLRLKEVILSEPLEGILRRINSLTDERDLIRSRIESITNEIDQKILEASSSGEIPSQVSDLERTLNDLKIELESVENALQDLSKTRPQYAEYTKFKEGEYAEILLYPSEDFVNKWKMHYDSPHFGKYGENLLAHARVSIVKDSEGNRVLFVEEIQSDWLQKVRNNRRLLHKYGTEPLDSLPSDFKVSITAGGDCFIYNEDGLILYEKKLSNPADLRLLEQAKKDAVSRLNEIIEESKQLSEAPFLDTWQKLVMQRLFAYAIENNCSKVSWTPGWMQIERYNNLYRKIEKIAWDGNNLEIYLKDAPSEPKKFSQMSALYLLDEIGDENAVRLIEKMTGKIVAEMLGDELTIRGTGMKVSYDEIIPSFIEKYLEKYDKNIRIGETIFPDMNVALPSVDIPYSFSEVVRAIGQPMMFQKVADDADAVLGYSPLVNVLQELYDQRKQEVISVKQLLSYLQGRGVRRNELRWTGVESFLSNKKSVNLEELLEFVKTNQVRIKEVQLSEDVIREKTEQLARRLDDLQQEIEEARRQWDAYKLSDEFVERRKRLSSLWEQYNKAITEDDPAELQRLYDEIDTLEREQADKYHEILNRKLIEKSEIEKEMQYIPLNYAPFYERYISEGGTVKGYAELLFYLPSHVSYGFESPHFTRPGTNVNLIAHARVTVRENNAGKRILYIEEIQSDWLQGLRDSRRFLKKYGSDEVEKLPSFFEVVKLKKGKKSRYVVYDTENKFVLYEYIPADVSATDEVNMRIAREFGVQELNKLIRKFRDEFPEAPFEDTWQENVIQRLIKYAADKGCGEISWTTGEEQRLRYGVISPNSKGIGWDGSVLYEIDKQNKKSVISEDISAVDLNKYVGNDISIRFIEQVKEGKEAFASVEEINKDKTGMYVAYDEVIPALMKKIFKQFMPNVSVGVTEIGNTKAHSIPIPSDVLAEIQKARFKLNFQTVAKSDEWYSGMTIPEMQQEMDKLNQIIFSAAEKIKQVSEFLHSPDEIGKITDEDVKKWAELFLYMRRRFDSIDLLTGVPNRDRFIIEYPARMKREPHFIVSIDLDSLKVVNDKLGGHIVGDRYIVEFIQSLKTLFDQEDIYRRGGDEFVVMIRKSQFENLEEAEKTIRNQLAKLQDELMKKRFLYTDPDSGKRMGIPIRFSWGMADDEKTADNLMYVMKEEHKKVSILDLAKEVPNEVSFQRISFGDVDEQQQEYLIAMMKANRIRNWSLYDAVRTALGEEDLTNIRYDYIVSRLHRKAEELMNNLDTREAGKAIESIAQEIESHLEYNLHMNILKDRYVPPPLSIAGESEHLQTWFAKNRYEAVQISAAYETMKMIKEHLLKNVDDPSFIPEVNENAIRAFDEWRKFAADLKETMKDKAIHGGIFMGKQLEDAVGLTNYSLVDYTNYSMLDGIMRSIFPFWMFYSRTWRLYLEQLMLHPEYAAFYSKYLQYSKRKAYEKGMVTSRGEQLPSLRGYVPIPGTNLWYNPTAPLIFRYVFPFESEYNDEENGEDGTIMRVLDFLYNEARIRGLGVHPLIGYLAYIAKIEHYPMLNPVAEAVRWAFPLGWIPPFAERFIMSQMRKISSDIPETWNPKVDWQDYMIEREILSNALMQMKGKTEDEKNKIANEVFRLMSDPDRYNNPMWIEARNKYEMDEWYRKVAGQLTGIYTKRINEGMIDLFILRNEVNLLKQGINNEIKANLFELDRSAVERYQKYLDMRYNTPEGWLYNAYQSIRFVTDQSGKSVNGQERIDIIASEFAHQAREEAYYDALSKLVKDRDEKLRDLPVGVPQSLQRKIWDEYWDSRMKLEQEFPDVVYSPKYVSGVKPEEQIYEDLREKWWRMIMETEPKWNIEDGETYEEYKREKTVWLAGLPMMARELAPRFSILVGDMQMKLLAGQDITDIPQRLIKETTQNGYEEFRKSRHTIYDAIEEAYDKLYFDDYMSILVTYKGAEREFRRREFNKLHPEPPSIKELAKWVMENYPGKFTMEQLEDAMSDRKFETAEKAYSYHETEEEKKEREIWEWLSWASPGNGLSKLRSFITKSGGDPTDLDVWFEVGGGKNAWKNPKFREFAERFHSELQQAVTALNLRPPTDEELQEWMVANRLNEMYKEKAKQRFGDDILDINGIYGRLNNTERKVWRAQNPNSYRRLKGFWEWRKLWGNEYPLWMKYYYPNSYKMYMGIEVVLQQEKVKETPTETSNIYHGTPVIPR